MKTESLSKAVVNGAQYQEPWWELKPKCATCAHKRQRVGEIAPFKTGKVDWCKKDQFEVMVGIGCTEYKENLRTRIKRWFS